MGCFPQAADFFWQWQSSDPLDLVDIATGSQIPADILEFRRILACWDLELDLRIVTCVISAPLLQNLLHI
jgi:hypothetical protein